MNPNDQTNQNPMPGMPTNPAQPGGAPVSVPPMPDAGQPVVPPMPAGEVTPPVAPTPAVPAMPTSEPMAPVSEPAPVAGSDLPAAPVNPAGMPTQPGQN